MLPASQKDRWLDRWIPTIRARTPNGPIFEIGCGTGWDTKILNDAGFSVVAIDADESALKKARHLVQEAQFHHQDMTKGLRIGSTRFAVILGSLSMHYFNWNTTVDLISQVNSGLASGGLFLFRVNSTKDKHYGSTGHPEIESHFYMVEKKPKRFFDRSDIKRLFSSGWKILNMEEQKIDRYDQPKWVWEVILELTPTHPAYHKRRHEFALISCSL